MNREQYVAEATQLFLSGMLDVLSPTHMEIFLERIPDVLAKRSQEMQAYLIHDVDALTRHGNSVRTLLGKIELLRGLIGALLIDRNNDLLRIQAVQTIGYLEAECTAMNMLLH